MQAACKNEPDSTEAKRAVDLLYETALVSSGFTVSHKIMLQIKSNTSKEISGLTLAIWVILTS